MSGLRTIVIIFLTWAMVGCATPVTRVNAQVPGEITELILDDLIAELQPRFPPAKTTLTVYEDVRLDTRLRNAGYAVEQRGDTNIISVATHYVEEIGTYLGVVRLGAGYTLTRIYWFENGVLSHSGSSLADDAVVFTDQEANNE